MNDKEPAQGHLPRSRASLEEARQKVAQDRHLIHNLDADRRSPIGSLVPWKQIACKAESHHEGKKRQPNQPDELTWFFIRTPEKDLGHMREDTDHHGGGAPEMVTQQEPAVVDVVKNVLGTGVGMVGGGDIVEHQQHARDRLHDEDK